MTALSPQAASPPTSESVTQAWPGGAVVWSAAMSSRKSLSKNLAVLWETNQREVALADQEEGHGHRWEIAVSLPAAEEGRDKGCDLPTGQHSGLSLT